MAGPSENPVESPTPKGSRFGSPAPLRQSLDVLATRRDVYRAKLIFYLFLVSLAVFFTAGMISYWIILSQSFQPITREYLELKLPLAFWLSTIALIFISGFLQAAVWCVRREYQMAFRRYLVFAWIAALGFLVIQYAGMSSLFETHFSRSDGSSKAYGLCFTMALVHALHVVGGIVFLGWIIRQGYRNRYDHERNYAVEHCAAYWHFLDVVWIGMLLTFLFTG